MAPESIEKWCKQGNLKGIIVKDHLYISERELERFLGMKEGVFCGNENMSEDGEPLGVLAEAQLPLAVSEDVYHPGSCAQAA